jgi:hypothetical protein
VSRPTFERACAQYVHRFTMEHVPQWARGKGAPVTLALFALAFVFFGVCAAAGLRKERVL